jgi:serine/threonine protein kinase
MIMPDQAIRLGGFSVEKELFSGRSGRVLLATFGGSQVVVKAMRKDSIKPEWVENEIRAGELLRHKGLVRYRETLEDIKYKYLIVDYVKGDDLWQFMQNRNWSPLNEKEAKAIMKQIGKTIQYCHSLGIAHKDIKLENIVIDKKMHTTLIDFGFCEFNCSAKYSRRFDGTLDYMPPEELMHIPFDAYKADVFALGILLYVLTTGNFPFDWKARCKMLSKGEIPYVDLNANCCATFSPALKDLLAKMLDPSPDQRINLGGFLRHSWLHERRMEFVKYFQRSP